MHRIRRNKKYLDPRQICSCNSRAIDNNLKVEVCFVELTIEQ